MYYGFCQHVQTPQNHRDPAMTPVTISTQISPIIPKLSYRSLVGTTRLVPMPRSMRQPGGRRQAARPCGFR